MTASTFNPNDATPTIAEYGVAMAVASDGSLLDTKQGMIRRISREMMLASG
jgi:hypothetical protein